MSALGEGSAVGLLFPGNRILFARCSSTGSTKSQPDSSCGFDSVGDMKFTEVERDLLGVKCIIWAGLESIKGFIYGLS